MIRIIALLIALSPTVCWAYPNAERGNLSLGLSQTTQFAISSDNQSLYICFGNKAKIVDTGSFALATTQPFDISADTTKYPGQFTGLIYFSAQNSLICPQDNGKAIQYTLNNIGATPTILTLGTSVQLGKGVADTVGGNDIYVVDSTNTQILKYNVSTGSVTPIALTQLIVGGFTINNILFLPGGSSATSEVYLTTSKGTVIYFNLSNLAPQVITVDSTLTHQLQGISALPDNTAIYVVDATATTVSKIRASDHTVVATIDMTPNGLLTYDLIANVTQPTGVYGYVAGSGGISIFDTSNNDVFDSGVTSDDNEPLPVSGTGPMVASGDGYVYISAAGGNIGVVSDNPFVTVNSKTYSSGSSLGIGGTVTISFQADETGTYVIRSGGNVSGNGTVLKDNSGNESGTVATKNTAQDVVVPYNSNSSALEEGSNTVYFFVTDSAGNVGRRSTTVSVDTPPPAVSVTSTGFGNQKAYLNFSRINQSDINYYNIYIDTDPAAVATKTTVATTVSQGSDSTLTGTVGGLSNGTVYYMAILAVDNAGNVGTRTTTLSTGGAISATPELTVGPAGLAGQTSCSLFPSHLYWGVWAPLILLGIILWRWRSLAVLILLFSSSAWASGQDNFPFTKYGATFAMKGSLWQPTNSTTKQFFPAFFNWTGMVEGGFLYNEQIGADVGVGFMYKTGNAISPSTGAASQDTFKLITIPINIGGSYRFLYTRKQWVVPYVKGGMALDYFYENDDGTKFKGLKKGLYGGAGIQVPITKWSDDLVPEGSEGQVYVITEALYRWVNDFGGSGLDLSGAVYSLGFLFSF